MDLNCYCTDLPELVSKPEDLLFEVAPPPLLFLGLLLAFPPLPDVALDLIRLPADLGSEGEWPTEKLGVLTVAVTELEEEEEAVPVLGCSRDCRDALVGCRCILRLVP